MKRIILAEGLGIRLYLFRKLRYEELFDAGHQLQMSTIFLHCGDADIFLDH